MNERYKDSLEVNREKLMNLYKQLEENNVISEQVSLDEETKEREYQIDEEDEDMLINSSHNQAQIENNYGLVDEQNFISQN